MPGDMDPSTRHPLAMPRPVASTVMSPAATRPPFHGQPALCRKAPNRMGRRTAFPNGSTGLEKPQIKPQENPGQTQTVSVVNRHRFVHRLIASGSRKRTRRGSSETVGRSLRASPSADSCRHGQDRAVAVSAVTQGLRQETRHFFFFWPRPCWSVSVRRILAWNPVVFPAIQGRVSMSDRLVPDPGAELSLIGHLRTG